MRRVYLDNNATTRADPEVVAKMLPFFSEEFGNASSSHGFGVEVSGAVREARRSVQALLGAAHDHEIVFTSAVRNRTMRRSWPGSRRARVATRSSPPPSSTPRSCRSSNICKRLAASPCISLASTRAGASISTLFAQRWGRRPRSSRRCGRTTKPARCFPSKNWRVSRMRQALCFIPTLCRRSARSPIDLKDDADRFPFAFRT